MYTLRLWDEGSEISFSRSLVVLIIPDGRRSAACNNLCSKCYRDEQVAKERAVTAVQASSAMISPSAAGSSEVFAKPSGLSLRDTTQLEAPSASTLQQEDIVEPAAETRQSLATSSSVQPPERPNKPTRCHFCRKKVSPRKYNHAPWLLQGCNWMRSSRFSRQAIF